MKISGSSIIKSLIIITILFVAFAFGAYLLRNSIYKSTKNALSLKSNESLVIELNNSLPLSDKLAIENNKGSVSSDVFKNVKFDLINNSSRNVNYELYITKDEKVENEINGQYIKLFLSKENGHTLKGFNRDSVPNYDNLNIIKDKPDSRILYKGTIKGHDIEKFDFKTWISDSYNNFSKNENFKYSIRVRVI